MNLIRVTALAQSDVDALLSHSEATFGEEATRRYRLLLNDAVNRIRSGPTQAGAPFNHEPGPAPRVYHPRLAKRRLAVADRVARQRHVLVFRFRDEMIVLVRALHEPMDFPRHLAGV